VQVEKTTHIFFRKEYVKMNQKFRWAIGALVIALVAVAVYGATTAYADDGNPPQGFGGHGRGGPGGPRGERSLEGAALEAAADALDMSTDDLSAALADDKTLKELADEAGVDMQEVFDAMSAVRAESMRERIAQAVEDGSMPQEKADWLLEGLDKGFLDGPGFGIGRGFGDRPEKGDPPAQVE
jgi:hypothetical protein